MHTSTLLNLSEKVVDTGRVDLVESPAKKEVDNGHVDHNYRQRKKGAKDRKGGAGRLTIPSANKPLVSRSNQAATKSTKVEN